MTALLQDLRYAFRTLRKSSGFAPVDALLVIVALAAYYFPTRRAMRVDPLIAIRYE